VPGQTPADKLLPVAKSVGFDVTIVWVEGEPVPPINEVSVVAVSVVEVNEVVDAVDTEPSAA
jgi:hypothetical protein